MEAQQKRCAASTSEVGESLKIQRGDHTAEKVYILDQGDTSLLPMPAFL